MRALKRCRGVTLIELLVVLALLAIVAGLAAPSFTGILRNNRASAAANELNLFLQYARTEALTRSASITVARAQNTWTASEAAVTLRQLVLSGVTVDTSASSLIFRANGTTATVFSIIACADNQLTSGQKIVIERSGKSKTSAQGKDENGRSITQCTL